MIDCKPDDSSVCQQIRDYDHRKAEVYFIYERFALVTDTIILISSVLVLYRVVIVYKRKDWFLFWTPMFYFLFGLCYVPQDILILCDELNSNLRSWLAVFGFWCYLMGHWTFSAQYLQTAFILPLLFVEAKLEWLLQHTQDSLVNAPAVKKGDYSRLNDELSYYEQVNNKTTTSDNDTSF